MFLNELVNYYSKKIALVTGSAIIGIESLFSDLQKNIETGKQKILDLSLDIISQSFVLVQFDWQKDPTDSLKEKIEKFFNKQKTVLTIYTAMTNYLPQNICYDLAKVIIKNLIENYQKSYAELSKIESKNNAKQ